MQKTVPKREPHPRSRRGEGPVPAGPRRSLIKRRSLRARAFEISGPAETARQGRQSSAEPPKISTSQRPSFRKALIYLPLSK